MKNKLQGFTLIEIMIVVVIVGIISSIAYPSYVEYVREGNRAEAKAALIEGAHALERYYSVNGTYLDAGVLATVYPASLVSKYNIGPAAATADGYTLRATRTGDMAGDPCGNFELNQTGVRTLNDATRTVAECW